MKAFNTIVACALMAGGSLAWSQAKEVRIAHIYGKTGALEAYAKQTQARWRCSAARS